MATTLLARASSAYGNEVPRCPGAQAASALVWEDLTPPQTPRWSQGITDQQACRPRLLHHERLLLVGHPNSKATPTLKPHHVVFFKKMFE